MLIISNLFYLTRTRFCWRCNRWSPLTLEVIWSAIVDVWWHIDLQNKAITKIEAITFNIREKRETIDNYLWLSSQKHRFEHGPHANKIYSLIYQSMNQVFLERPLKISILDIKETSCTQCTVSTPQLQITAPTKSNCENVHYYLKYQDRPIFSISSDLHHTWFLVHMKSIFSKLKKLRQVNLTNLWRVMLKNN